MSIIDADFPSGSQGLYALQEAPLLEGRYAEILASATTLANDPDPNVTEGVVLACGGVGSGNSGLRYVYPASDTEFGFAYRLWMIDLPAVTSGNGRKMPMVQWRSVDNTAMISVWVSTTGQIVVTSGSETGTELGRTGGPVLTAKAWNHIEIKVTQSATVGTVQVKVRGKSVINLTGVNTGASAYAQMFFGNAAYGSTYSISSYYKDCVWWDTNGSVNNDFLGQVSVFYPRPQATLEAGGWISNAGADADETVSKPRYANVLTASGAISSGDQVRINTTYYNWTSGSVDAGTPAGTSANPWLVAMGASAAEALANMYAAIGATGTPGTTYSTGLTAHTTVTPFGLTDETIAVIPTDGVTVSMTFSETGANTAWLSTSAFQLRVHDEIRMSAGYTSAVAATGSVTFSGLPVADETVDIGAETYTFKASASNPFEVTIGGDANETGDNLVTTITADSTLVTGSNAAGVVTLTAISAGAAGNSITLAEAATNTAVSGATLTGGVDVTYPDPFEIRLDPLPDDVTSIKAVIPIVRAANVDGGDGNIQVSFGVSDASYDDGPDTVLTTAFTYWGNDTEPFVSEINPLTTAPWSVGEFNLAAKMKVARTL